VYVLANGGDEIICEWDLIIRFCFHDPDYIISFKGYIVGCTVLHHDAANAVIINIDNRWHTRAYLGAQMLAT